MNATDINIELNNHTKELEEWNKKFKDQYSNFTTIFDVTAWQKAWPDHLDYKYVYIGFTSTIYTKFYVYVELHNNDDRVYVRVEVDSCIQCWKKLKRTGYTRKYDDFKFEYVDQAFRYIKEIRHIIFQKEELVQKSIGIAVRQCEAIKDQY